MVYPEHFIAPMREELTRHGVIETRTPEEVDKLLVPGSGTVLVVINSVCGCAAGSARPGVIQSLENDVRPQKVATVFAGGDVAAVARVREILSDYPPSSPCVTLFAVASRSTCCTLFRGGEPIYMLHRHQIEGRDPSQIAATLKEAYNQHCVKEPEECET